MDSADSYIQNAEQDASPDRFQRIGDDGRPLERAESDTSSSSSVSYTGEAQNRSGSRRMSRMRTQNDNPGDLERHATAMSRIETQRTQHGATVGSTKTRKSLPPLPAFGAGKPYPPPLPEREEYVVEFDGADDPRHAQNWPFGRK